MKRLGVTIVLGGVAFGIFLYAQPLLTLRVLAKALEASDTAEVRERMDAELVRQSLRHDYLSRLGREPDQSDRNAAVIASLALFGRGLEMLMAAFGGNGQRSDIAGWRFESTSRFVVTLEAEPGVSTGLVLLRRGLGWRLIAMRPSEAAWRELGL